MSQAGLQRWAGSAVLLAVALATPISISAAAARSRRAPHRVAERVQAQTPSPDAIDLGTLAPPTRRTTLEQNYGDAAFARARVRARDGTDGRGEGVPSPYVQFPCEPRRAGVGAYRCGPYAGLPGYGLGYAYNPAYVTSPFSSGHDPRDQEPVLPGVTSFFWAVNGIAAGHLD